MIFPIERIEKWLHVAGVILRVLAIALGGATADQLLVEGRVGELLAGPARELSSKSSAAEPVALLHRPSPLA